MVTLSLWLFVRKFLHTKGKVCCCSVPMSCPPGLPARHYFPEFALIHFHWPGVAIQPSHPLSPPSPPALHVYQHQGLFQWVSSSQEKAMATHSSVLAWRIPGAGEPSGLLPMGWHRVRHDWSDLAAAATALNIRKDHHLSIKLKPTLTAAAFGFQTTLSHPFSRVHPCLSK